MAIEKMKQVNIYGRLEFIDGAVDKCCKSGIFQPDHLIGSSADAHKFELIKEANIYSPALEKLAGTLKSAHIQLPEKSPEKSAKGIPPIKNAEVMAAYAEGFADKFNSLQHEKTVLSQIMAKNSNALEQFEHFAGLGFDLQELFACKFIKVRFGRLPKESYAKLKMYESNPFVLFFPCTHDNNYYWGVYFAPLENADDVDRIFSSLYFERMHIPEAAGTPEEAVAALKAENMEDKRKLDELEKSFLEYWEQEKENCFTAYAGLTRLESHYKMKSFAYHYHDNFILSGWIPANMEKDFEKELAQLHGIKYGFETPGRSVGKAPPVKLKNLRLFKPFEFYVDMYGLPNYNEVDPTPFVAITYIILFGIMFADVGQGLVISLAGWWMWHKKGMPLGKILKRCGISSSLFGLLFGSVFGFEELLDPFYHMLGLEGKPIHIMNSGTVTAIIVLAVALGVLLVSAAMCINIYSSLRRRDWESAVFGQNGIAGLIFYLSVIMGGLCKLLFNSGFVNTPYLICLVLLPLTVMFFRETLGKLAMREKAWKPEKWGEYLIQNFFEVFEFLLSYITNTMSFMRVGIFVLVHAGMMLMVFSLVELMGPVSSVMMVIAGNLIVIVMEALLVSIQTLRIEYYEMFSRFFSGDGKPYKPVNATTR